MNFEPNNIYHIYNQGNNRQKIFFSRDNYLFFLKKMRTHILPHADLLCYCLMPNHFHWMVYVRQEGCFATSSDDSKSSDDGQQAYTFLSDDPKKSSDKIGGHDYRKKQPLVQGIATLLSSYTRAINKQNQTTGSLFRQKTKAIPLIQEKIQTIHNRNHSNSDYIGICFNYIHQNPVKAKLVKYAGEWEFSSYPDFYGNRKGNICNSELVKNLEIT